MKLLTSGEMREVDRLTKELGIPGPILMENAGHRVVEYLTARWPIFSNQRIVVLCGKGNNGGDGFVIARQLLHASTRSRCTLRRLIRTRIQLHSACCARAVVPSTTPSRRRCAPRPSWWTRCSVRGSKALRVERRSNGFVRSTQAFPTRRCLQWMCRRG